MSIKGFTIDNDPLVISTGEDEFILAVMTLGFFDGPGILDLEQPAFEIYWSEPWNWDTKALYITIQTGDPSKFRIFADAWKALAVYQKRQKSPLQPTEFTGFLKEMGYKDMTNYELMKKKPDYRIRLHELVQPKSSFERPESKKK